MKSALFILFLVVASCAPEPKYPALCQEQLAMCLSTDHGWYCRWAHRCGPNDWTVKCHEQEDLCALIVHGE